MENMELLQAMRQMLSENNRQMMDEMIMSKTML